MVRCVRDHRGLEPRNGERANVVNKTAIETPIAITPEGGPGDGAEKVEAQDGFRSRGREQAEIRIAHGMKMPDHPILAIDTT